MRERSMTERMLIAEQAAAAEFAAARARLEGIGPTVPAVALEKAWHMLHFLFTGSIGPVGGPGDALMAGEDLGEDLGYGPPRLLDAKATLNFARFLNSLDVTELVARVNCAEMLRENVYGMPMGPGAEAEEGALRAEVAHFFPLLRDTVAKAAEIDGGLLIWLT